jgi:hypothetical protein
MDEQAKEFLLVEFNKLRDEILQSLKETWNLERQSVIAAGVIWTWCLANAKTPGYTILIWTPLAITTLSALRSLGLLLQMQHLGRYVRRLEQDFPLPKGLGWESSALNDQFRRFAGIVFWVILIAMTVVIPLLYQR